MNSSSENPQFADRLAMISHHRVRPDTPHNGPSFFALLAYLDELAAFGYTGICFDLYAMLPYTAAPDIAVATTWTRDQVAALSRRLDELARGVTPIIWRDMLEHYPEALSDLPDARPTNSSGRP